MMIVHDAYEAARAHERAIDARREAVLRERRRQEDEIAFTLAWAYERWLHWLNGTVPLDPAKRKAMCAEWPSLAENYHRLMRAARERARRSTQVPRHRKQRERKEQACGRRR